MKKAIGLGLAVGLIVATFETVQAKRSTTSTWGAAVKSGVMNTTTLAATAAAVVAGFVL